MKKVLFLCGNCGYQSSKWLGKCPECSTWNSFVEEAVNIRPGHGSESAAPRGGRISAVPVSGIKDDEKQRLFTGIAELDRVLGGIIPGQAILISGEPGIGKSTLVLEAADKLSANGKVFYINGEESNSQIKLRAGRLGAGQCGVLLFPENDVDEISAVVRRDSPKFVFVDSIQTVFSPAFDSLPGSVVQMRESAYTLVKLCKELDITLFIVGHVTKSGIIAGPKILEHIVDTVLFLEMDGRGYYRILRSNKNRFFSTDEIGFFTMEEAGLKCINNVSEAFLYSHEGEVSGISFFPMAEGNRIIPVEIQALTSPTQFNYPKRTSDGMDMSRLYMLLAVMEKYLKIDLSHHDVYLNITNGLHIQDPGLDLPVVAAVYSSIKAMPSALDLMACGEVGLTGEVRPVIKIDKRIAESSRNIFKKMIIPYQTGKLKKPPEGAFKIYPVKNISECVSLMF
ncbi:MAG: DNA repair protein RadA [Brevinematales bacterium]|jgi:DNA repair protein RadA/Sms